jgi:hypothetical protein
MEECVASGGRVDPTQRHCELGPGFLQLREHAIGHATDPGLVLPIVLVLAAAPGNREADEKRTNRWE